jgi:4-hydroxy-4-methyl-2-oxoglutarate aldolase
VALGASFVASASPPPTAPARHDDLAPRGLAVPGVQELVDELPLRGGERRVREQPPGLDGVVVRDRSLEMLTRGQRLAELPSQPAEKADAGRVHRLRFYTGTAWAGSSVPDAASGRRRGRSLPGDVASLDPQELQSRFAALYTGAIADVLDRMGFRQQTLPPEITPLRPGTRLAGPAYPIEGRPREQQDYDTSIRRVLEMLGQVPAGHVAVYQTHDRRSAHLGELSVTSLKARGCAGAVIDGGCRDVDLIIRENYPVFARYTTPQDCTYRWELVAHGDVTVEVGDVRVASGDYVVADADGIVVVPHGVLLDVLHEAEEKAATESEIRNAVRAGTLPLAAYERFGTF